MENFETNSISRTFLVKKVSRLDFDILEEEHNIIRDASAVGACALGIITGGIVAIPSSVDSEWLNFAIATFLTIASTGFGVSALKSMLQSISTKAGLEDNRNTYALRLNMLVDKAIEAEANSVTPEVTKEVARTR